MHKHTLMWMAVFCVIALMFLQLPQMAARQDAVMVTYSALVEVDALAKQQYVEPIEPDGLVEGAIRGMLSRLDPYSGYISPHELTAFERRSKGSYIGVGMEVGVRAGKATVIAPIEGGPAARAGVLAGDILLSINGRDVEGLSIFDVNELLGGKPGTAVRVSVLHPGRTEPEDMTLVREPVTLRTVRGYRRSESGSWSYLIDPQSRIAYVRVGGFHENTMADFDRVLRRVLSRGSAGLIIDLRFNPGGLMDQAVALVDRFVSEGTILSTVTRHRAVDEYRATAPGTVSDLRLAVLMNGGSASASEIVAGALQDHGRAVVVGERSFGKGSVQHLIHLKAHDAAIKLTVAHYRLPEGRIIHRTPLNEHTDSWGVMPDVVVELTNAEVRAIQQSRQALDLASTGPHHPFADGAGDDRAYEPRESPSREIVRDRQLEAALTLLRIAD